jgi:hypothetical protein
MLQTPAVILRAGFASRARKLPAVRDQPLVPIKSCVQALEDIVEFSYCPCLVGLGVLPRDLDVHGADGLVFYDRSK